MPDTFASRLTRLREQAGLSRQQLADKAGMAHVVVWRLEKGQRQPAFETVEKLAAALGASLGDFDAR